MLLYAEIKPINGGSMNHSANVFVLGDSISMHYGPDLKRFIEPRMRYGRKGEGELEGDLNLAGQINGGDSAACLLYLERLLARRPAIDYLVWNCGLHDIKTTATGVQIPIDDYIGNLECGIVLIKSSGIQPVWLRTTPVADEIHNSRMQEFSRYNRDVLAYNEAADRVMTAAEVPTIDLYDFTFHFGAEAFIDHVHFIDSVRTLQAAFIAGHLLAWS